MFNALLDAQVVAMAASHPVQTCVQGVKDLVLCLVVKHVLPIVVQGASSIVRIPVQLTAVHLA